MTPKIETLLAWREGVLSRYEHARGSNDYSFLLAVVTDELEFILDLIGSDLEVAEHIAAESYAHANGFAKIVLGRTVGDQASAILHVWDAAWPPINTEDNVHNHRWPLCSTLISGRLEYEHYCHHSTGRPLLHYRYDRGAGHSGYAMRFVGRSTLRCVESGIREERDVYLLAEEALHRIRPVTAFAATLVVQGSPVRNETDVFSEHEGLESAHVLPPCMDIKFLQYRCMQVKEALAGSANGRIHR